VADKVNQKPNIFQRMVTGVQTIVKETVGELRKVTWPSRDEATNLTKIVLVVIFAMTLFLGVLDFVYTEIFRLILGA
jgi:preprotein translocase subunit SecE